jgi:hypothetical protein
LHGLGTVDGELASRSARRHRATAGPGDPAKRILCDHA